MRMWPNFIYVKETNIPIGLKNINITRDSDQSMQCCFAHTCFVILDLAGAKFLSEIAECFLAKG